MICMQDIAESSLPIN